jgi:hypothetical protein
VCVRVAKLTNTSGSIAFKKSKKKKIKQINWRRVQLRVDLFVRFVRRACFGLVGFETKSKFIEKKKKILNLSVMK